MQCLPDLDRQPDLTIAGVAHAANIGVAPNALPQTLAAAKKVAGWGSQRCFGRDTLLVSYDAPTKS